MMNRIIAGTLN